MLKAIILGNGRGVEKGRDLNPAGTISFCVELQGQGRARDSRAWEAAICVLRPSLQGVRQTRPPCGLWKTVRNTVVSLPHFSRSEEEQQTLQKIGWGFTVCSGAQGPFPPFVCFMLMIPQCFSECRLWYLTYPGRKVSSQAFIWEINSPGSRTVCWLKIQLASHCQAPFPGGDLFLQISPSGTQTGMPLCQDSHLCCHPSTGISPSLREPGNSRDDVGGWSQGLLSLLSRADVYWNLPSNWGWIPGLVFTLALILLTGLHWTKACCFMPTGLTDHSISNMAPLSLCSTGLCFFDHQN